MCGRSLFCACMGKVLVACEFSGIVRDAFIARGHEAVSCDLLPSERPGPHYQCDVRSLDLSRYDLMVAHPPCTYLANSGNAWRSTRNPADVEAALDFVRWLLDAPVSHIAVENPVGIISSRIRPADDYIQPFWFGHPYTKKTGLWLKNLPVLRITNNVPVISGGADSTCGGASIGQLYSPSPDRWKLRSRTFQGIADAMADQWGKLI